MEGSANTVYFEDFKNLKFNYKGKQCNYLGSICFQKRCVCPPGQLYNGKQCINDPNIPNGNYIFI